MKKFIAVLVILVAAAGTVFFIGWVQFLIEPGQCGVLISKTSGIDTDPILPGTFSWKWERLLPTNAQIRIFPMESTSFTKTVSDSLPSAKIYSSRLDENPDFSYSVSCEITLGITPKGLLALIKSDNIKDAAALQKYLDSTADSVTYSITSWILTASAKDPLLLPQNTSTQDILNAIGASEKYPLVNISTIAIKSLKIPDMQLYEKAKATYFHYQSELDAALKEKANSEAAEIAEDDRAMKKLEKIGELLQKYPTLSDFLKTQDSEKLLGGLESN